MSTQAWLQILSVHATGSPPLPSARLMCVSQDEVISFLNISARSRPM